MHITDPVADMLTRIRNANNAKHDTVDVPASNMKKSIAQILLDEGYIKNFQLIDDGLLHIGRGDVHGVMLGVVRVADAGEHIRNGIRDVHEYLPPLTDYRPFPYRYRRQGIGEQAISPTC